MANTGSQGGRIGRGEVAELLGVKPETLLRWQESGIGPHFDKTTRTYALAELGEWMRTEMPFMRGRGGGYPFLPDRQRLTEILKIVVTTPLLPGMEPPRATTKSEEEIRLLQLKSDKLEMELKEHARELIPADEISQSWVEICGKIKTKIVRIPSAAAPIVAIKSDVSEIQRVLEDFIHESLEDLSGNAEI